MGEKREADNRVARSWYRHRYIHNRPCVCGHPEWRHMGINEPACTHLGTCTCPLFTRATEMTA